MGDSNRSMTSSPAEEESPNLHDLFSSSDPDSADTSRLNSSSNSSQPTAADEGAMMINGINPQGESTNMLEEA